jgi:hypothetical protein
MSQVCSKCSHANPPDAIYCYYDGIILGGHSANGGPVQAGTQLFPSQFVFPSGATCRNFDQLAVACQQNWTAAVDLLRQGFLASFLGGIGRVDLALAAQEAARFPDQERGLDQLLAKLPTQVLQPPQLQAEPTNVNLGVLPLGSNRHFELHLANLGMRLLYGSVVSDCKWLALGEAPGNPQKLFQFGAEATIPVQVRGQHLRAGNKALEGHLVVESNGGAVTITVRADVPTKPYPDGVLAGATTPRQIAEKAHAAPKDAAPLFESGAVARWFGDNGWTYPVQGPSASGVGAVQQFFEALGLSKAPKVDISLTSITLRGNVGETLQASLELKAQEKRPIYAHAICDQPWLDVGNTILAGRTATIMVLVGRVPDRPGETLQAQVTVTSNGNQKFVVPVTLEIGGIPRLYPEVLPVATAAPPVVMPVSVQPIPVQPIPVQPIPVQPIPVLPAYIPPPVVVAEVAPPVVPVVPVQFEAPPVLAAAPPVVVAEPFAPTIPLAPVTAPPVAPPLAPAVPFAAGPPPVAAAYAAAGVTAAPPAAPFVPVPVTAPPRPGSNLAPLAVRAAIHAVPALVLVFFLIVVFGRDIFVTPLRGEDNIPIDETPTIAVHFDDTNFNEEIKQQGFGSMRFGLIANPKGKQPKKLTYSKYGLTNSTVVRIDGAALKYGFANKGQSRWITRSEPLGQHGGRKSVWLYEGGASKVQITQLVEIVPGEPVEYKKDKFKRYYDTCRVRYVLENKGKDTPSVGLRILIDTLIGDDDSNDGVPFTVPGVRGLVDSMANFDDPAKMPDFLQVLEVPNLSNPGIVGFMNLKIGGGAEPPGRVLLTRWTPRDDLWDVPEQPFNLPLPADSAVVLYWNEKPLAPNERRELGFSYGLGNLAISGKLGVSVGGSFVTGGDLTVVALVNNPEKNQTVTLKLPKGLRVVEGDLKQAVPPATGTAQQSPVSWRIRADHEGTFVIEVQSGTNVSKKTISIKTRTIF